MAFKKKSEPETITITEVGEGEAQVWVYGKSPLVLHCMAAKAMQELLLPSGKKTTADRAATLKHDPIAEYRYSAHTVPPGNPTLLAFPSSGFKRAMASAAIDLPGGAKKAQIGRLVYLPMEMVPVYGKPKLFMRVTRNSDMNHTPDVRTRCIVPEWAALLTIRYVHPILKPNLVLSLLHAAGIYIGVGDGRPEKGALSYGRFDILAPGKAADKQLAEILKADRAVQEAAMETPECYDRESEELLSWYLAEVQKRGSTKPTRIQTVNGQEAAQEIDTA